METSLPTRFGLDRTTLFALSLLVLALLTFAVVVILVQSGRTQEADKEGVRWLRNTVHASRLDPKMSDEIGRDLTALGGVALLALMTLGVVGYLLVSGKKSAALLVLGATLGGLALSSLLKHLIDRARPDVVEHLSNVVTSSFPSGHSMMAATVYLTLALLLDQFLSEKRLRVYVLSLALLLTLLVGVSRVYMGVHYPTDVLAGWSAGLAWALACWLLAQWLQKRGTVEKAS